MSIPNKKEAVVDFLEIQGRKITLLGRIYTYLCILSLGVLHIICKLFPSFKILLTSKECKLKHADCVVLVNKYNKIDFRYLKYYDIPKHYNILKYHNITNFIHENRVKILDTEYGRFLFNYPQNRFVISKYILNKKDTLKMIIDRKLVLSDEEENIEIFCKKILYGLNDYNLRLPSVLNIFIENTFNLTVFINLFCIILWIKIEYVSYALIISVFFVYGYFQQVTTEINLKNNLENAQDSKSILVFRNKRFTPLKSYEILPGDLLCIKPCTELFCDAVLLKGDVISDESFLTGESVPICKSATLRSVLYSGTSILRSVSNSNYTEDTNSESLHRVLNLLSVETQCTNKDRKSDYAIGIVIGTGFNTLRGNIMKDIINPKPVNIEFLNRAYKSISRLVYCSFFASFVLFFYLKYLLLWSMNDCWTYILDLFFSLASPTLYASLSIGIQLSNNNLKKSGISCNNLDRIYLASNVDIAIFDKTGTLTSDGMELTYIDNCIIFMEDIKEVDNLTRMGLSACHSVYELEGRYSGDTLDLEMFIFSESKLEYDDNNIRYIKIGTDNQIQGPFLKEFDNEVELLFYKNEDNDELSIISDNYTKEIAILETVDFTSESRMMSVIVQDNKKKYYFCKGSPDKIGSLLINKPDNYDDRVRDHSLNGYRVISMAYREEDEDTLKFLCFIVFSNKLKPESIPVIKELRCADIQTNICTGDNILTAISVSRECGIIDENTAVIFPVVDENCKNIYDVEWVCLGDSDLFFDKSKLGVYKNNYKEFSDDFVIACEGKEYDFFSKTYYKTFILDKGRVFARFSPAQKKSLVEDFRNINKNVLFCGDGANDSSAIGTADVGIALAQNEASLASSFCARDINAVPLLIKECRNAYVTSLARYKFVVMTGFLVYFNMIFLVCRNKFYTDFQSLHIDILLILTISYYLSDFNKSNFLSVIKPECFNSDLSLIRNLLFISPMVFTNFLIGLLEDAYPYLEKTSKSATYLFFINSLQVIFSGLQVSDCTPFREGLFVNKRFLIVSFSLSFVSLFLLIISYLCPYLLLDIYKFSVIDTYDFFSILFILLLNGIVCYGISVLSKIKIY